MKTRVIKLVKGQKLGDVGLTLTETYTHIQGGTGAGKTWWLLNKLARQQRLVMVVPTVSQLRQVQNNYRRRYDLAFVSGEDKTAIKKPNIAKRSIVCTYDQLGLIMRTLGESEVKNRILVIDEAHKLYQAGGYRGTAIHGLLVNFERSPWARIVTVSATFSTFMVRLACLRPDEWVAVEEASRPKRDFTARYYQPSEFPKWPGELMRLAKSHDRKGMIIVRVNAKRQIDELYHTFTAAGLKCLRVYSDIQDDIEIRRFLEDSVIEGDIDVLFTTSLIDEAINLMNVDDDVHSIHIIGSRSHVEEITQFIGRFRVANPPVFLHLSKKGVIGYDAELTYEATADELEKAIYEGLEDMYKESLGVAGALAKLAESRLASDTEVLKRNIETLNATYRRCFGFAPLRLLLRKEVRTSKVVVNTGSLLAQTYREEAEAMYSLFDYLARCLQRAIPGCVVSKEDVQVTELSPEMQDCFDEGEVVAADLMKEAKREVVNKLRKHLVGCIPEHMPEMAREFVRVFGTHTLRGNLCQMMAEILVAIPDYEEAAKILFRDQRDDVLAAYEGLRDELVQRIHAQLKKESLPLKVDGEAACKLVVNAAREVVKANPLFKQALDSQRGQRSGLRTKANNHVDVDARTALAILRANTYTTAKAEDGEEERKRGTVTIYGLYYGDYHYRGFNELRVKGDLDAEFADDVPITVELVKTDKAA